MVAGSTPRKRGAGRGRGAACLGAHAQEGGGWGEGGGRGRATSEALGFVRLLLPAPVTASGARALPVCVCGIRRHAPVGYTKWKEWFPTRTVRPVQRVHRRFNLMHFLSNAFVVTVLVNDLTSEYVPVSPTGHLVLTVVRATGRASRVASQIGRLLGTWCETRCAGPRRLRRPDAAAMPGAWSPA